MKLTALKVGLLALGFFRVLQGNAQEKQIQNPTKIFSKMDTNKDGSISLVEVAHVKRRQNYQLRTNKKDL